MVCYSACLVFEAINHHNAGHSFYENVWMLVKSEDEDTARNILLQSGYEREESFMNVHSELLEWRFLGLRQMKIHESSETAVELVSISERHPGFIDISADSIQGKITGN